MKECEGGNEVLNPLVEMLKYREYCEWVLKKEARDSYMVLCKHGLYWYHEGLIEKEHSVVALSLNQVIEVSVKSRELLRVNHETVNGIEHNQVLDLSDDGERWEGDALDNQPYGWGMLYDSENRMAYEGFRLNDVNVCYGTQYYSDIGVIEYKGEWFEGKRWGRGVLYDRTGKTVFEGEWINDSNAFEKQLTIINGETQLFHNHIEELIVSNDCCNGLEWRVLDLPFLSHLRLFEVGDECFEHVEEVKLIRSNQLERVVIGEKCFTKEKSGSNDPNRHFYLKNCEKVRELKIGSYSFMDFSVCEIENVPSLEVIEMDGRSFQFTSKLELKSDDQRMK